MQSDARVLLAEIREPQWHETVAARVSFSLALLVFLAIPTFVLLVNDTSLLLYYSLYPVLVAFSLYLRYRRYDYWASLTMTLSVYGVVSWLAWLTGLSRVSELELWIVALLPLVLFDSSSRLTTGFLAVLPVGFSFSLGFLPPLHSPLLPAERDFIAQMLKISVAMGAFSCVYYLRRQYIAANEKRSLENEFYSHTLNSIPMPIIIKDAITLDYVFYNDAAAMTFDLRPGLRHSNQTTFSESCAAAVSRLDYEVLRSVTYHIEPDENLVHSTGLTWHFRTYRIPLELKSNGRRLLVTVSEDLRAVNLLLRRAEETQKLLNQVMELSAPLLVRYDHRQRKVHTVEAGSPPSGHAELGAYLEFFFSRNPISTTGQHLFQLGAQRYLLFYGQGGAGGVEGMVIALHGEHTQEIG